MRIGMIMLHSCARTYKMGWQLLGQGNKVHLITERIYGSHPWRDFTTTSAIWTGYNMTDKFDREQLKTTCEALDEIVDLWHIHNEPDWMVRVVREITEKPIIWDVHDLKSQRSGSIDSDEEEALGACNGISVVSQRYKEIIAKRTDKPCEEILNSVPSWLYPKVRRKLQFPGIVYEGGIKNVKGNASEQIDSRNWFETFKYLTGEGIPVWAYSNHAMEDLTDYGNVGVIVFRPLDYTALLKNLTAHEVGLVGAPTPSGWFDGALPNKLFEYLAAGLPVICLNAPDAAAFVESAGVGVGVSSMEEIPKALETIRNETVAGEPVREYVWNHFRHWWTLETQMPKLEKLYQAAAERVYGPLTDEPQVDG